MTTSKPSASHLHILNILVATIAGLISIVGGVYSLKSTVFADKSPGQLQGIVLDQKLSKPLWLVPVEVSLPDGSVMDTTTTDREGKYSIHELKAGSYMVKVSAPLHISQTKNVTIEHKRISTINFEIEPVKIEPEAVPETNKINISNPIQNYPVQNYPAPTTPYRGQNDQTDIYPSNPQQGTTAVTWKQPSHMRPRRPRTFAEEQTNNTATQSSFGGALAQTGTQLLQEWLQKKTSDQTQ